MNIPEEVVERIKDATNIVDVIGDFLSLYKKGVNYWGICPFHADKFPSLCVNPNKGLFKCFACGEGGDAIKFLQRQENLSYPEALVWLANKYHIEIPTTTLSPEEQQMHKIKESLFIALQQAQQHFTNNLQLPEADTYLKQRNIEPNIITQYGLGYAVKGLSKTMLQQGYSQDILAGVNLMEQGESGWYDKFRARITFPFYNLQGRIIGFTGRIIDNTKNTAKYLNTSDTLLFSKGKVLYGLYQAKQAIASADEAFLVEGQFDVLSFAQAGCPNTVCGSGTALTEDQAKLLMRFTRNITLIYDADAAGLKACIKNTKTLLAANANVRIIALPAGEDPDSFAKKMGTEKLLRYIASKKESFLDYLYNVHKDQLEDPYRKEEILLLLCDIISAIPEESVRADFIARTAEYFRLEIDTIQQKVKPARNIQVEPWKDGFFGYVEAKELLDKEENPKPCLLTFDENDFKFHFGNTPVIYAQGRPTKPQIQILRSNIKHLLFEDQWKLSFNANNESPYLLVLKDLFKEGIAIDVTDEDNVLHGFAEYYVGIYGTALKREAITDKIRGIYIDRCAEIISFAENTVRTVMLKEWAGILGLSSAAQLKEIVKPYLEKIKDKAALDTKRLNVDAKLFEYDPDKVPDYVYQDEIMAKTYNSHGFYPILNERKEPVSYMFKNAQGGGHTCVSDFYMEPLLHVYSKDTQANKRVIKLNHLYLNTTKYVEWPSSVFANLGKVNEYLINEGAYNFEGNLLQFRKIWKNMSYNFTFCRELKVFGQQPEEFFAFTNAIFHESDGAYKVEYVDKLGITTHAGENYYSPAFSEIYSSERKDNDLFEQDRYFIYKDIPVEKQTSFQEWASLMNEVYKINDNGKWAILACILCAFRDFVYANKKYFTSLFFIGPTSSGKSQIAFSMRSLFIDIDAPAFNLNTGTDAAFFLSLERLRNVFVVMEEYNDNQISPAKFQALKAATLDGEGRIKVKDASNKTTDSSKINSVPILLGQEAPQQDDGSLANRCILCNVPSRASGEYSQHETDIFNKLKEKEHIGLSNILIDILKLRPLFKKYFLLIHTEEVTKLKDATRMKGSNTEGLTRILNAVSLMLATCRLMEEHAQHLKLPFTYEEFFEIACQKVLKQVEIISSSNKQSTYFNTIAFLLNQGSLKIGKELKIEQPGRVKKLTSGKQTEEIILDPPATKVLHIYFEGIYPLYHKAVGEKEALSRSSLRSYFESNPAYLGQCKSTKFHWDQVREIPRGDITGSGVDMEMKRIVEKKTNNTSSYMFNYDILKDLMGIDFEREVQESTEDTPPPTILQEAAPIIDMPF